MARARAGTTTILGLVSAVVAALVAVSCSGDDPGAEDRPRLPPRAVTPSDPVRDGAYDWRPMTIGGGGFVTGMVAAEADGEAVVYARTDVGGAYRWDEDAGRWHQLLRTGTLADGELTEADYSVDGIAVAPSDPDTVLLVAGADDNPREGAAGGADGRVLRSTDGGETWAASEQRWSVNGNQRFRTGGESLAIDPVDPDLVHLGTQRDGLWRSTDGGATWERVPTDEVPDGVDDEPAQDQAGVSLVAAVPGDAGPAPAVLVAGVAGEGVYVSDDGGERWERHLELDRGEVPSSATVAGDDLVLSVDTPGASGARLLRLADLAGPVEVTELPVPSQATTWNVAADPHDGDRLVLTDEAVRDERLWTSSDGGETWRVHDVAIDAEAVPWLAATDLETYMSAGRLLFDPVERGRVWFAEGMGAWRTDELAADTVTWSSVALGIEELVVSGIVAPPGGAPIVTVADRQGFRFPDEDRVPNATLVDPRFGSGTGLDYSAGDPTALAWVGAESHLGSAAAEPQGATSRDGGASWERMGGLDPAVYGGEVAVSATDPDSIVWLPTRDGSPAGYLTDPLGLYRSSDGGASWEQVRPDGDVDSFHRFFWWFGRRALAADRVDGRFYLLSDEERFYASDDGGATWAEARHAPPCREDTDCHVFGQVQAVPGEAGRLWASTGTSGLHRTDDAGRTRWRRVAGIAEARAFAFGAPVGDTDEPAVYVHGRVDEDDPLALWRSVDGGDTWSLVSRHPARLAMAINALAADPAVPGRVYVGFAGAGAVRGDDPELDGELAAG